MSAGASIEVADVAEHGGGKLDRAFAGLKTEKALVMGVESDILFPSEQQRELSRWLGDSGIEVHETVLGSPQGHDSFLVDLEGFGTCIANFLDAL